MLSSRWKMTDINLRAKYKRSCKSQLQPDCKNQKGHDALRLLLYKIYIHYYSESRVCHHVWNGCFDTYVNSVYLKVKSKKLLWKKRIAIK